MPKSRSAFQLVQRLVCLEHSKMWRESPGRQGPSSCIETAPGGGVGQGSSFLSILGNSARKLPLLENWILPSCHSTSEIQVLSLGPESSTFPSFPRQSIYTAKVARFSSPASFQHPLCFYHLQDKMPRPFPILITLSIHSLIRQEADPKMTEAVKRVGSDIKLIKPSSNPSSTTHQLCDLQQITQSFYASASSSGKEQSNTHLGGLSWELNKRICVKSKESWMS